MGGFCVPDSAPCAGYEDDFVFEFGGCAGVWRKVRERHVFQVGGGVSVVRLGGLTKSRRAPVTIIIVQFQLN